MRKASAAFYRGVKSGQDEYREKIHALEAELAAAHAVLKSLRSLGEQDDKRENGDP